MNSKRTIYFLLIIGLIFRIVISFSDQSGDVSTLMLWGEDTAKNGIQGLYERGFEKDYGHISPNYPPLAIFLFLLAYSINGLIYQFAWYLNIHIPFFPSNLIFFLRDFDFYPYLIKLPAILSDIGIAYLTYLFTSKLIGSKKTNWPILSAVLILFNPAYFYNSSVWGQTDSIPLFFVLLSFYFLLLLKRHLLSIIFFTLAILSKQTVFIFTPIFLYFYLKIFNSRKLIISTIIGSITFIGLFIPFYKQGNILTFPFLTYLNKILLSPGIPYTSNHAFNLWYLLTGSRQILASQKFIADQSYEFWGYLITGVLSVLILLKLFKDKPRLENILFSASLIALTSFLFLTKMHERHLILVLPFLLLIVKKNKLIFISYIYISLFNFLNMYHDWWSPNVIILMKVLSSTLVLKLLTLILISLYILLLKLYLLSPKNKIS